MLCKSYDENPTHQTLRESLFYIALKQFKNILHNSYFGTPKKQYPKLHKTFKVTISFK